LEVADDGGGYQKGDLVEVVEEEGGGGGVGVGLLCDSFEDEVERDDLIEDEEDEKVGVGEVKVFIVVADEQYFLFEGHSG